MPSDDLLRVHEANMRAALESYYSRVHEEPATVDMPFDEVLQSESDGLEGEPGEYEFAQRRAAMRSFFRYLIADGIHPLQIMKRLYALGRGFHQAPFCNLTMREAAMMFSETKAAHSWRMKFLSGAIEQAGMKGSRLPGQKTKAARKSYARCRMGNEIRKKGKKRFLQKATKETKKDKAL